MRRAGLGARVPRRRTLVLALALVLPLGGFGTWVLWGSPWLRAENVSVDGTRALTRSEVTRAAAVPLGEPLISVDKGAVQRRVRAALPRVREVVAERDWPHGITLTVTERRPELAMEKAGKYVEVDAEGVRFATDDKPPKGVPLLAVEPKKEAAERYFSARRLRKEAARVATSLPDAVQDATRLVRVRSYDDITVELAEDRTVRWGSAERGKAKAAALTALLKAAEDATHFDVTVPSAPAASGG
ncbi:cell division protein FtsQ/DivIB [Streptomyces tubbatahanensis]|uniref:cell division protein FtsQ/DivIB n=1 Tax=Streptomyces tubbatahanensis TaxID=2923272 RepID=UPI003C6FF405